MATSFYFLVLKKRGKMGEGGLLAGSLSGSWVSVSCPAVISTEEAPAQVYVQRHQRTIYLTQQTNRITPSQDLVVVLVLNSMERAPISERFSVSQNLSDQKTEKGTDYDENSLISLKDKSA